MRARRIRLVGHSGAKIAAVAVAARGQEDHRQHGQRRQVNQFEIAGRYRPGRCEAGHCDDEQAGGDREQRKDTTAYRRGPDRDCGPAAEVEPAQMVLEVDMQPLAPGRARLAGGDLYQAGADPSSEWQAS